VSGVATALGTLAAIVVVGWLLGRYRVLGENAAPVLARTTFTVAIPALLVVTIAHADLHLLLSRVAVVTAASTTAVVVIAVAVLRGVWRLGIGDATVATLAASYLNGAHLGIPIAVYVVGDAVAVVPTLLFQLLVLAPVAFALLDRAHLTEPPTPDAAWPRDDAAAPVTPDSAPEAPEDLTPAGAARGAGVLLRTIRNPIIVAALVGVLLAVAPWQLPEVVFEPFRLVGAAAAPMALVAFGMSLAVRRPAGRRWISRELGRVMVLRAVVHPVLAAVVGNALGLDRPALLAVVTMAALPTAQNVLVFALQYGRGQALARDAGLATTLLTIPVMLVIAATLG
jgi:hypothetical protein